MAKFYIVPKANIKIEAYGSDKEFTLKTFAATTDMSQYFEVLTEEELTERQMKTDTEAHKRHVTAFMKTTLIKDFNVKDENVASMLAADAYEKYCDGDGQTEYECIEEAYDEWKNEEGFA